MSASVFIRTPLQIGNEHERQPIPTSGNHRIAATNRGPVGAAASPNKPGARLAVGNGDQAGDADKVDDDDNDGVDPEPQILTLGPKDEAPQVHHG